MPQHYGSFAKGFIDAFLAAQRLQMQQGLYDARTAYYKSLTDKSDPAKAAATAAMNANAAQRGALVGGGAGGGAGGGGKAVGGWWTPERMQHASERLQSEAGLSEHGAAGLVARWAGVEASGGPESVNPKSGAFGIGQWLGPRLPAIKGNTDFDAQIGHAIKELNGPEGPALGVDVLRKASSFGEAARGASMFEKAEGWNAKTGTDNYTNSTPVEEVYGAIKRGSGTAALHDRSPAAADDVPADAPADVKDAAGTSAATTGKRISYEEAARTTLSKPGAPYTGAVPPPVGGDAPPKTPDKTSMLDGGDDDLTSNSFASEAPTSGIPAGDDDYAMASPTMASPAMDDDYMGAARGGIVKRYARGGPVTRYGAGGDVSSEDDDIDDPSSPEYEPDPTPAPDDASFTAQEGEGGGGGALPIEDVRYSTPGITSGGMRGGMGGGMGGGLGRMGGGMPHPAHVGKTELPMRDETPAPPPGVPQITDGEGGLAGGAVEAIKGGVAFIAHMLGGKGAVQEGPHQASGRDAFHAGEYAQTPEELAQGKRAVNPGGELNEHLNNIAYLEGLYEFYISHGDPGRAHVAAASVLEALRLSSVKYGAEAYNLLSRGNREGGARAAEHSYDETPDGRTAHVTPLPDGGYDVQLKDMNGRVVHEQRASEQQMLALALGQKNGTVFYQALNEAVAPKPAKPAAGTMSPEGTKALALIMGDGGGAAVAGAPAAGAAGAAGAPAPAPKTAIPITPAATEGEGTPPADDTTDDTTSDDTAPPEGRDAAIDTAATPGGKPAVKAPPKTGIDDGFMRQSEAEDASFLSKMSDELLSTLPQMSPEIKAAIAASPSGPEQVRLINAWKVQSGYNAKKTSIEKQIAAASTRRNAMRGEQARAVAASTLSGVQDKRAAQRAADAERRAEEGRVHSDERAEKGRQATDERAEKGRKAADDRAETGRQAVERRELNKPITFDDYNKTYGEQLEPNKMGDDTAASLNPDVSLGEAKKQYGDRFSVGDRSLLPNYARQIGMDSHLDPASVHQLLAQVLNPVAHSNNDTPEPTYSTTANDIKVMGHDGIMVLADVGGAQLRIRQDIFGKLAGMVSAQREYAVRQGRKAGDEGAAQWNKDYEDRQLQDYQRAAGDKWMGTNRGAIPVDAGGSGINTGGEGLPPTSKYLGGAPAPPEGARVRPLSDITPHIDMSRRGRWDGPAPARRTVSPSDIGMQPRRAIPEEGADRTDQQHSGRGALLPYQDDRQPMGTPPRRQLWQTDYSNPAALSQSAREARRRGENTVSAGDAFSRRQQMGRDEALLPYQHDKSASAWPNDPGYDDSTSTSRKRDVSDAADRASSRAGVKERRRKAIADDTTERALETARSQPRWPR